MTLPFVTVDNTRLFYRLEGQAGRPVLVLSHSIGADHGMWTPQVVDLLPHFQILRYDTRGHGASDVTNGEYSIELLARDVLGITDALGFAQFAFCGLSLGGAIGPTASGATITYACLSAHWPIGPTWTRPTRARDRGESCPAGVARVRAWSRWRSWCDQVLRNPASCESMGRSAVVVY